MSSAARSASSLGLAIMQLRRMAGELQRITARTAFPLSPPTQATTGALRVELQTLESALRTDYQSFKNGEPKMIDGTSPSVQAEINAVPGSFPATATMLRRLLPSR